MKPSRTQSMQPPIWLIREFALLLRRLVLDESGQDLIEYALIAGLLGLGAVAALSSLSTAISTALSRVGSTLISST